jgi:hypothetical protein
VCGLTTSRSAISASLNPLGHQGEHPALGGGQLADLRRATELEAGPSQLFVVA